MAKRERPDVLRFWTFVSNADAQRFYRRHGFQEVERTELLGRDPQRNWALSRRR